MHSCRRVVCHWFLQMASTPFLYMVGCKGGKRCVMPLRPCSNMTTLAVSGDDEATWMQWVHQGWLQPGQPLPAGATPEYKA